YLVAGRSASIFCRPASARAAAGAATPREGGDAGRGAVSSGFSRKDELGVIGQIGPAIAQARGVPAGETLWAFELNADALGAQGRGDDLRAESLPRFPSIVRDLSVLVDAALPAASVRGTIRAAAPATLTHVIEFDRYRGKGVPEGRLSLSLRLTFRSPERTLTDAEVDAAMEGIVSALAPAHNPLSPQDRP